MEVLSTDGNGLVVRTSSLTRNPAASRLKRTPAPKVAAV